MSPTSAASSPTSIASGWPARQAAAELVKEQKARAADQDAARTAQAAAQQALQAEKSAHRDAAAAWSRKEQGQVELATLRERAAGEPAVKVGV